MAARRCVVCSNAAMSALRSAAAYCWQHRPLCDALHTTKQIFCRSSQGAYLTVIRLGILKLNLWLTADSAFCKFSFTFGDHIKMCISLLILSAKRSTLTVLYNTQHTHSTV